MSEKNLFLFTYYKKINDNRCVKQFVMVHNGVLIAIEPKILNEKVKGIFKYAYADIPNYSYESYQNYVNGKGAFELESYADFKFKNNIR